MPNLSAQKIIIANLASVIGTQRTGAEKGYTIK